MAAMIFRGIFFVCMTMCVLCDEIEMEVQSGTILKMLRDMVNQTASDTLNLPANSTSIRENITDTFSCENRTYGYYADVDNDCQIFHVCLPSQAPSGKNVTYRWSFICPKETVFNQEALVCTYERDSVPCESSPDLYYLNMDIGKIADPEIKEEENKDTESVPTKKVIRQPNRKKQNIIMEALLKEAEQIEPLEDIIELPDVVADTEFEVRDSEAKVEGTKAEDPVVEESKVDVKVEDSQLDGTKVEDTVVEESKVDVKVEDSQVESAKIEGAPVEDAKVESDDSRLGTERSLKRTAMRSRGSRKFRLDA